jgi:hypothetical protein
MKKKTYKFLIDIEATTEKEALNFYKIIMKNKKQKMDKIDEINYDYLYNCNEIFSRIKDKIALIDLEMLHDQVQHFLDSIEDRINYFKKERIKKL